jgi:hypothetical protein
VLVRAANTLDLSRISPQIQTEVTSLLKLLLAEHIAADVALPFETPMNKITPAFGTRHICLCAAINGDQLLNNPESRRRQSGCNRQPARWRRADVEMMRDEQIDTLHAPPFRKRRTQ